MKVLALLCAGAAAGGSCTAPPALGAWSAPAPLRGCAAALAATPPLVVFPASAPAARSGPGALLWNAPAGCEPGVGRGAARGASAAGAPLGATGLPGPGRALDGTTGGLGQLVAATGTTAGQVLVVGTGGSGGGGAAGGARVSPGTDAFVEGRQPGAFSKASALGGTAEPVSAFSGYLGDAVLASAVRVHRGWALAVRVQRHYASWPSRPRLLPVGARPTALAATLDYRADVLLTWAAGGELYAREIANTGAFGPLMRIAPAPPAGGGEAWQPEIRVLFSDDDRGIIAWRSQQAAAGTGGTTAGAAGTAATTLIQASISGPGLGFGAPAVVERFADPRGLRPPPGSLQLVRMSSEAVMMAWSGVHAGRYVVRASPVSLRRGVWAPVTVSPPGGREALLAELVPGAHAEVLALWSASPRLPDGALDGRHRAILAAWGHYGGHGEAVFAPPETLAPPGPNGVPAAAFDPDNDRALAAWVTSAGSPRIVYAQRAAGPPALAAPAQLAIARVARSPAARARGTPASAPSRATARPGSPRASTRTSVLSHGAGRRGTVLAAVALALLLVAAAAAYRGIGRRRGWIGARRA
ncbi:MAG TPA: hypothetical protein VMS02_05690 [Solirubrobacteraceae bacterium]|nr:hypothetical protein [Solirubrobacteraceae bacterium]